MNSTYVIARRELAEKRFVFTAAFAFAILTLLLPLVVRNEKRIRRLCYSRLPGMQALQIEVPEQGLRLLRGAIEGR